LGPFASRIVNGSLRRLGLEIVWASPELRPLPSYGIQTVLDIGASCGDFLMRVRPILPGAFIHCFEPLPELYALLEKRVRRDPRAKAWNLAVGDADGVQIMHRHEDIFMSSLLPLTEHTVKAFPSTAKWSPQEVKLTSLDKWAESQILEPRLLIKMDVQGYERHVIKGGMSTIQKADLLLTEVSFMQLYEGEYLFDELYQTLRTLGFRCVAMGHPSRDPTTGRSLQNDILFARA
jgi:FkbM family methyltransferase